MKNIDLRGHIAVITGATGNIGPAIARTLAECGADVAICFHKNAEKAGSLAEAIRADYGVRAISVQVDVADIASVFRLRDSVKADLGDADILVNAAVADDPASSVLAMDEQSCVSMFQSCVMHSVHMAKAFVPAMQRRKWGRIIGINTECAMQCFETQAAYSGAKRAMDGVYRILAKEVGAYGITVNQVAPGWVLRDHETESYDPEERNGAQPFPYISTIPLRRRGTDTDVANAVAFLASDLAGFITGVYLPVCGGNVMPCI